jgi:hypothetical protein
MCEEAQNIASLLLEAGEFLNTTADEVLFVYCCLAVYNKSAGRVPAQIAGKKRWIVS